MEIFDYKFTVNAPLSAVQAFHHSTSVLSRLTPPPLIMRVHEFGDMREGMEAKFTLWAGPIPLRYHVIHENVSPNGFTDVQLSGPLASWRHTHTFEAISAEKTTVHEHIEYSHPAGLQGMLTRLLFNKLGLYLLFTYRTLITRRGVRQHLPQLSG